MNQETDRKNIQDQPDIDVSRHEHKPLSAAQNVAMTIKVLLGAAIVLGAIMALDMMIG